MHSPGIANIIVFRSKAAETMRLVDDEEDDLDMLLNKLSKKIIHDVKQLELDKGHYDIMYHLQGLLNLSVIP